MVKGEYFEFSSVKKGKADVTLMKLGETHQSSNLLSCCTIDQHNASCRKDAETLFHLCNLLDFA